MLAGMGRPLTSDAVNTRSHLHAPDAGQLDHNFKMPPLANSPRFLAGRSSSEFSQRYVEGPSPVLRGYSPNLGSRGFGEEQKGYPPQKKSRLNLLNPMSLLARRRTSQNPVDTPELTIKTMHVPDMPADFNPSIRGTITHDFSAPRSRRTPSHPDVGHMDSSRHDLGPQSAATSSDTFGLSPNPQVTVTHSPMFREHFQDDRTAIRPEQTTYLHQAAAKVAWESDNLGKSMPAFAKKLPTRPPEQQFDSRSRLHPEPPSLDRPLPQAPISPPPPTPPPKHTPTLSPPEPYQCPPSPPRDDRTPTPPLNIPAPSNLPKHMTSTSSRFSFQIAPSTQEKLLEEKHKQYQANKRVSSLSHAHSVDGDNFDDYDFDADAGMEEDVPEFNVDDFEGEDDFPSDEPSFDRSRIENSTSMQRQILQPVWPPKEDDGFDDEDVQYDRSKIETMTSQKPEGMVGFHFTPDSLTFSPTSSNHMSQPTPRDDDGVAIGVADTRELPSKRHRHQRSQSAASVEQTREFLEGLGIATTHVGLQKDKAIVMQRESQRFDDEDLYFDDGEFADNIAEHQTDEPFDEEMLDNEQAVRDIPAENMRRMESAMRKAGEEGTVEVSQKKSNSTEKQVNFTEPSRYRGSSMSVVTGLTEGNLAAYHDLLANAANEAAANGKFNRVSFSQDSEDESQPGVISDESRFSNNFGASGIAYDDGFPFDDDDMDDEMMIAAANAEALENDDDGFYGQEFGFYARARNKEDNDMINGGFFAPRGSGSNGIKRSHSGRANFQEPSLTPITERSEWSTRNSVASLHIPSGFPHSAQSLPSPGIAQLLERDSPVHDDDMTLSALMKLRRGAFGGSSSSVSSLTGNSHNTISSPLAQHHGHPFSPQYEQGHSRMNSSVHSIPNSLGIPETEEDEDYLGVDEPTLTQNTPMKKSVEPHRPTTPQGYDGYVMPMSPTQGLTSAGSKRSNHSRASSGAESVSYSRDTDGRWVLERRRTGESGYEEVDREYLAAANI